MPLTQKVEFKAVLQKGNRVQVPKPVRWQFKLEPNQVLKVGVTALGTWSSHQFFYAQTRKDGRIQIPRLIITLIKGEKTNLENYILNITLEPT